MLYHAANSLFSLYRLHFISANSLSSVQSSDVVISIIFSKFSYYSDLKSIVYLHYMKR